MIEIIHLLPGVTLRACRDSRFKQGCLSFQFLRQMRQEESHLNALLPSVMLRGTVPHPDLRCITRHLDDLYGGSIGPLVRRLGDWQSTGFYLSFLDDRFAMAGDQVAAGMTAFLEETLTQPLLEKGCFLEEIVESEKKNLISTIESELNNKGAYAMGKMLRIMCREDSFGIPRLGTVESVTKIQPKELYDHYLRLRKESPIEIFYVGSMTAGEISGLLRPMIEKWDRAPLSLPAQTPFIPGESFDEQETMEISQGKLCLGFSTPITSREGDYAAMMVLCSIFGSGMTSKLFMNVREKLSLCYSIGASYYGTKGILTVSAGIDFDKEALTRQETLRQLEACRDGKITEDELTAAKESICSGIRATHDSPGAIEAYYSTALLTGSRRTADVYLEQIRQVTLADVMAAAQSLTLRGSYFLRGDA